MTKTASPVRWGTIAELAAESGLSDKTIRRYVSTGLVRAERVGPKRIRVDMDSLRDPKPTSIVEHIERLVRNAPPLTAPQRNRIAALIGGGA